MSLHFGTYYPDVEMHCEWITNHQLQLIPRFPLRCQTKIKLD